MGEAAREGKELALDVGIGQHGLDGLRAQRVRFDVRFDRLRLERVGFDGFDRLGLDGLGNVRLDLQRDAFGQRFGIDGIRFRLLRQRLLWNRKRNRHRHRHRHAGHALTHSGSDADDDTWRFPLIARFSYFKPRLRAGFFFARAGGRDPSRSMP